MTTLAKSLTHPTERVSRCGWPEGEAESDEERAVYAQQGPEDHGGSAREVERAESEEEAKATPQPIRRERIELKGEPVKQSERGRTIDPERRGRSVMTKPGAPEGEREGWGLLGGLGGLGAAPGRPWN